MRVLLIKTSSMGDLIHTLPALTDAAKAIPGIQFDWLVEKGFAAIPALHPAVDRIIPVEHRRWRRTLYKPQTWKEIFGTLRSTLREQEYDLILDAQGLVKSAWFGYLAKGQRAGLDWRSARESWSSLLYKHKHTVNFYQHAVVRMRSLFSLALGYEFSGEPDFGIAAALPKAQANDGKPYLIFLHGTTWVSKQWPESYWIQLAEMAKNAGYDVKISGASPAEVARAGRIAAACDAVEARPRISIKEMTLLLAGAQGVVSVDTGFGHLAGAMDLPTIAIYGSTNPEYTGTLGARAEQLHANFACAPCLQRECRFKGLSTVQPACYETVPPVLAWQKLIENMKL